MTKPLIVKQKKFFWVFTSSTKVRFAPETCQKIPGSSEVIDHGNGKNREIQKSLLTGTGKTGKFRSHFLSLCTQIFVFCVFKFLLEPGSRYALMSLPVLYESVSSV